MNFNDYYHKIKLPYYLLVADVPELPVELLLPPPEFELFEKFEPLE